MRRKTLMVLAMAAVLGLAACGGSDTSASTSTSVSAVVTDTVKEDTEPTKEVTVTEEPTATPAPTAEALAEGMYRSELTNEAISEEIKDIRPIAVMVDNESIALPHMGLNQADIVYEIMNSTANGRITRFMCIVKDWRNIEQFGSVRSARPTNFLIAPEYNAILCHDGGPFYIDEYVAKDYTNNLSGGFGRFNNGKNWEFTEYITSEGYTNPDTGKTYTGLIKRIDNSGYSKTYNDYYSGPHFTFYEGGDRKLSDTPDIDPITAKVIGVDLPYPHNSSRLVYNEETSTYDYYEYGMAHNDPLDGDKIMTFKNVIIQDVTFSQLDENGYLIYNVISQGAGYYLTNGELEPINWIKRSETAQTEFTNATTGEPIVLNTGKTYITLCPDDVWGEVKYTYAE